MARKKSNKKNKAHNRRTFKDVLEKFHQKNFLGAATLLKKAKITSAEAGQAKQLKIAILHQLGLQFLTNKQLDKTIHLLSGSLDMQSKPGFPLRHDLTHTLIGLSHLYLGQFEKAQNSLKRGTDWAIFYQLLALIYDLATQLGSFDNFVKTNQTIIDKLPQNKQNYLHFAWLLVHQQFKKAALILKNINFEGIISKQNTGILLQLLQQQNITTFEKEDKQTIPSLYKVLARIKPDEHEKAYLAHIEEFEEYLFYEEDKAHYFQMEQLLSLMCDEGKPLEETQFQYCFHKIRDDLKPYFVYNQIANSFNSKSREFNMNSLRYVRKYNSLFFQIPESALLYLDIVLKQPDRVRPESFWQNTITIMKRFEQSWSSNQISSFGWKIQHCCIDSTLARHNNGSGIVTFCTQFPNVVGVKLHLFLENSYGSYNRFPNIVKDFFSLGALVNNKKEVLEEFDDFIQSLDPYLPEYIDFIVSEKEKKELLMAKLETHHQLQDNILTCISAHPQVADKDLLVHIFTRIARSLKLYISEYDLIGRGVFYELENKMKNNLKLLEIDSTDLMESTN